ncbi:MAG: ArsR/SmtB family transcription factor [Synechococcus sp.]
MSAADSDVLSQVANYFKLLSEVSRLQVLNCLRDGPMNVNELVEATGLGQANISKHLKLLTEAGILERQPKGVSAYYSIADPTIFNLCELVCDRISERLLQQAESFKQFKALSTPKRSS